MEVEDEGRPEARAPIDSEPGRHKGKTFQPHLWNVVFVPSELTEQIYRNGAPETAEPTPIPSECGHQEHHQAEDGEQQA